MEYYFLLFKTNVMNNKTNKKLLVLSVLFIIFWAAMTLASSNSNNFLNVRPVLNRAIQTIQKIAFNVDAIRHPDALDKEVIVESNHGTVLIRWRVRALVDWTTGTLTPDSTGSSLFYWKNNYLAGTDSYIIGWENNRITSDVDVSAIIWGTNNTLVTWSSIYIIWGSGNTISGVNSYIVWWKNNRISWNDSYIIWWSDSTVTADKSVAAWSDIVIDKEHVFAWKDTSDNVKLNPKKSDTFILFAQNWISIWYPTPENVLPWTVNIKWVFQISTERKACGANIAGAVQYIPLITWDIVNLKDGPMTYQWELYWCYCSCDWSEWVSMIPSALCRTICPSITWAVDEDFQAWVCRYRWADKASIWWLDASQACDNWEATGFTTIWDAEHKYPVEWHWNCLGNVTSTSCVGTSDSCYQWLECWAKATKQNWKCAPNPDTSNNQVANSDYYTKCESWYPSALKSDWNTALYTWDCLGINGTDSGTEWDSCKACKENWTWVPGKGKCINQNWRCNWNFNGKNLGSLDNESKDSKWVGLCEYVQDWFTPNLVVTYWEDKKQNWWKWECKWEHSTAQCSATYRVDPWRCARGWNSNVRKTRGIYKDIATYWECWNGELTGLTQRDENNFVYWTCAWVNHPTSENCKWCPPWYNYNREAKVCERECCEYEPWYTHNAASWTITLNTCHISLTLMDKNIWATEPWYTSANVGKYFQRWNNYWFSVDWNDKLIESTTQTRPAWNNTYNRSWYYWNEFIVSSPNEDKCLLYNYWARPSDGETCTIHRDLWWWGIDWYVAWNYGDQFGMDTMYNVHSSRIKYFLEDKNDDPKKRYIKWSDYVLDTWALVRQWPCPDWWHVPSAWEWWALLNGYCELFPQSCIDDTDSKKKRSSLVKWILSRSVSSETLGNSFMMAFFLPKSGRIMADSHYPGKMWNKWQEGFYWSSSFISDEYVWYLWFNKAQIYATQTNGEIKRWAPIRCFKNPEIIDDTNPKNKCPDPFTLTIHYIKSNWQKATGDYVAEVGANELYSVNSPSIPDWKTETTTVSWRMPNQNKTITVEYTLK